MAENARLTAERDAAQDKALRFDVDALGITQRDRDAVALVDARATIARMAAERDEALARVGIWKDAYRLLEAACGVSVHE